MSQTNWEADKMLDVYIYDYLMKRKMHATAKAFQDEGKVSTDPVAIDAPGGFLFEWWSVFWDIFIARTNEKHSESAASFIETQLIKAREQQQKLQLPQPVPQNQQMQMQQLLLQRHAQQQQQQQRRDGGQLLNGVANVLVGSNDMLMRQSPTAASALAAQMYEERLKLPQQKDTFDDAAMKQRLGDNVGQILDPNQASLLKAAALGGQPSGQMLHGLPGGISGNIQQVQNRSQQHPSVPVSTQDKGEKMNSKVAGPDGSLIGIHGPSQGGNNLTLEGWPLPGLDRFRSGRLPQSNPLMQSPQPFNQLQQQLLLQAQQNLASPSANDMESRRLRMLISNRNMSFGKDGQLNSVGDVSNVGSPVPAGCPVLPHSDPDMMLKLQQQQTQNNNQQRQQYSQQHMLSSQTPQSSNHQMRQQDKVIGAGSVTADGSMSGSFQGNDQTSKGQIGRKRKQPVSSSGPANSSGTATTTGPSPSSPSSPSTHALGDTMSMATLPHKGGSSKPLLMFGSDGIGPVTTAPNQLGNVDHFVDDGSLEDNVESFLSDDAEPRDRVTQFAGVSKGFSFKEARVISASTSKVECCHFSPDGKLLATGGHDRKATLWCTESFTMKSALEEHTQWITDVRFSSNALRLATSSADKTVRVWDADNAGYSIRTFTGHSTAVMSLDFHPSKEDLLCSCDNNSEIRYWGVKNGSSAGVYKGGATQLRFQPCSGRILAAAVDNFVSLLDVETQVCRLKLQGHKNVVHSVCWDSSGEYLASVSDDLVRVWRVGSGSKGEPVHELNCTGNKFHTCAFHPIYPILVIGCYESLEIWNMAENKTTSIQAHDKLVSSLAVSKVTGLIASASHDKCVKLWQ